MGPTNLVLNFIEVFMVLWMYKFHFFISLFSQKNVSETKEKILIWFYGDKVCWPKTMKYFNYRWVNSYDSYIIIERFIIWIIPVMELQAKVKGSALQGLTPRITDTQWRHKWKLSEKSGRCTEVCFASFLSNGFTTMAVINPPENKLAKRNSVRCGRQNMLWPYLKIWDWDWILGLAGRP